MRHSHTCRFQPARVLPGRRRQRTWIFCFFVGFVCCDDDDDDDGRSGGQRFVVIRRALAAMKLAPMQKLPTIPVTVESRSSTCEVGSQSKENDQSVPCLPPNYGWTVASANEYTRFFWLAGELTHSLCTNLGLLCRRQTANNGVACMRPRAHCSPNSIHASEEVVEPSSQAILLSKKTATQTGMSLLGPRCGPSSSPLLASFRQAP